MYRIFASGIQGHKPLQSLTHVGKGSRRTRLTLFRCSHATRFHHLSGYGVLRLATGYTSLETTTRVSAIMRKNKTWIMCGNVELCKKMMGLNGLKTTSMMQIK